MDTENTCVFYRILQKKYILFYSTSVVNNRYQESDFEVTHNCKNAIKFTNR